MQDLTVTRCDHRENYCLALIQPHGYRLLHFKSRIAFPKATGFIRSIFLVPSLCVIPERWLWGIFDARHCVGLKTFLKTGAQQRAIIFSILSIDFVSVVIVYEMHHTAQNAFLHVVSLARKIDTVESVGRE